MAASCRTAESTGGQADRLVDDGEWAEVRAAFDIAPDILDFAALLISSHPRPVREAIERHRRELNQNPTVYLESNSRRLQNRVMQAAASYLGGRADEIALTDSTTMGLGLIYNGFVLRENEEFLISDHNYYSTLEAIRLSAQKSGGKVRYFELYEDSATVTADEVVENLRNAIRPETRVIALTWVHSSTGVKLPIRRMAGVVAEANRGRGPDERALLCIDAVHGFGVEDVTMGDLGCDFFVAGCHKWLFGPRGTGIVWASRDAWRRAIPTIPTFLDNDVRRAWIQGREPEGATDGPRMSPGGFKPFEHLWSVTEAFEFHQGIGKGRVAARTHELSRQLKAGLAEMDHVVLHTPISEELSSGIVCFDVRRMSPADVVSRLRRRGIVATTTPYAPTYARLTPSIRNTPAEIEQALDAIRGLG